MALRDWLQLALTEGIGPILTARLIAAAGGASAAVRADRRTLQSVEGIGSGKASALRDALAKSAAEVDAEIERAAAAGIGIICRDDDAYPRLLRTIPDPPSVLYLKGTLLPSDVNALALVGSRACSHYGREQAERFAALLAGTGMTVISGGARGVDSAAHRGALAHPDGRTIAVLGCGIDVVYPPENQALFGQIVDRGALVSEHPLGTPPLKENFPRRNRIVSGLSRGVLVIEADIASGALITARQACDDHGRPVFALPGRVDNKLSAGPHALIRDGAVLTTSLADILDNMGPLPDEIKADPDRSAENDAPSGELFSGAESMPTATSAMNAASPAVGQELNEDQRQVLEALGDGASDVDGVITHTDLAPEIVLRELTFLSLRGLVRRVDGKSYQRSRTALDRDAGKVTMRIQSDKLRVYAARPDELGVTHDFLQLRQAHGDFQAGTWQSVSGKITPDEPAWQSALRRLEEQTGLAPLEFYRVERLDSYYSPADDTLWHCPQFVALVDREAPIRLSGEHDAFRWVERKYVQTLFMWPNERRAVAEICAEILDDGPAREYLRIPVPEV